MIVVTNNEGTSGVPETARLLKDGRAAIRHAIDPEIGPDTMVFLAADREGDIASATSTSGWGWKNIRAALGTVR